MKRFKVLVGALACSAVVLTGSQALAANPHFAKNSPKFTVTEDSVIVSGKVVGLGKTTDEVVITLVANAQCQNPAGNDPPGLRRSETDGDFSVRNGQATFSLEAEFDCPGPHDIVIKDATVTVVLPGDDLSVTETF